MRRPVALLTVLALAVAPVPAEEAVVADAAAVAAAAECEAALVVAEEAVAVAAECEAAGKQDRRLSSRARCAAAGRSLRCTAAASPVVC